MKKTIFWGLVLALVLAVLPLAVGAPQADASCSCKANYVVKRGDTLKEIASRYHVTVNAITKCNGIKNPNRIRPGQHLCIPGVPSWPTHPPVCSWVWANGTWVWSCSGQPPYWPPPPGPIPPPPPVPPQPGCAIAPVQGFGNVWYNNWGVRSRLGCPQAPEQGIAANDQQFQYGYVVQDMTNKKVYIIFGSNHRWGRYDDTWQAGEPVNNPWIIPPPGYYQPEYGIGKVWRQVDNMSQRLGWGRRPQAAINATIQPYVGGMMLWSSTGGVFVLYNDGTWQQFR